MAQKKTTTKRKTTAKKQPAKKQTKKTSKRKEIEIIDIKSNRPKIVEEVPKSNTVAKEIWMLLIILVSIVMFLGVLNLAGGFGEIMHDFLCGLFGALGYVFPFIFAIVCIYLIRRFQYDRYKAVVKMLCLVVGFVCLCVIASLLDSMISSGIYKAYNFYDHGKEGFNGGLLGGSIAVLFYPNIGILASYIIFVFLAIICFVIATGRSILRPIRNTGRKIRERTKEDYEYVQENRNIREEERRIARSNKREEKLQARRDNLTRINRKTDGISLENITIKEAGDTVIPVSGEPIISKEMNAQEGEAKARAAAAEYASGLGINIHRNAESDVAEVADGPGPILGDDPNYDPSMGVKIPTPADPGDEIIDEATSEKSQKVSAKRKFMTASELDNLDDLGDVEDVRTNETESESPDIEVSLTSDSSSNDYMGEDVDAESTMPDVTPDVPPVVAVATATSASAATKPEATASAGAVFSTEAPKPRKRVAKKKSYKFPPIGLLEKGDKSNVTSNAELREVATKLEQTLVNFGVGAKVTDVSCGPTVTRYELKPDMGVKISKIVALKDDMKLALAASDIRIEAPIPGKAAVGVEVPNAVNSMVALRDILESQKFKTAKSNLAFGVGRDIGGDIVVTDIAKMPHLLIAGATGSGKSVCLNTIIMSILYRATPDEVKFIMIDPKQVELTLYANIPHMLVPVVTDARKAAAALNWGVAEMDQRYTKFKDLGVRDLVGYNEKIKEMQKEYDAAPEHDEDEERPELLPELVIIVDEMADLMMVAANEVENAIVRLAQLARAAGIHIILATQRPSVKVVTGLIKTNIPSRIALSVASGIDSRIIIDMTGAEELLGKGDMLFAPQWLPKPVRVQGAFVSDEEVQRVVDFWANQKDESQTAREKVLAKEIESKSTMGGESAAGSDEIDELFIECGKFIIENDKASIGNLQRRFRIGFNRAARIMDALSDAGAVGPDEGKKPREVLMDMAQFEEYVSSIYE